MMSGICDYGPEKGEEFKHITTECLDTCVRPAIHWFSVAVSTFKFSNMYSSF